MKVETINLETLEPNCSYYEFHFEPEIGHQNRAVMIFRALTLGSMFYHLAVDPKRLLALRECYILARVKQVTRGERLHGKRSERFTSETNII